MGTPGFRFLLGGIATLLAAVGLFGVGVRTAQADPHAVFYTAVGQQQLFFNVLAALDQADYVEHKSLPGLPPDNKLTRQGLLERRSEAGISVETDPRLVGTETDLAGILTRSITLEGQDLWTAYLTNERAVERQRRAGVDELIRLVYCERGLGRKGCEENSNLQESELDKKKAYVYDPVEFARQPYFRGAVAALGSGTEFDQQKRVGILDPENTEPKQPYEYDSYVAELRKEAAQKGEDAQLAVERLTSSVGQAFLAERVSPDVYSRDIKFVDGKAQPDIQPTGSGQAVSADEYIDRYTAKLTQFISAPGQLFETGLAATSRVEATQAITEQEGHLADQSLVPKLATQSDQQGTVSASASDLITIEAIGTRVEFPAQAKASLAREAGRLVGDNDLHLRNTTAETDTDPGDASLVPEGSTGTTAGASTSVLGSQSGNQQNEHPGALGQVAGCTSTTCTGSDSEHSPRPVIDTQVNPVLPHHESGALLWRKIATNDISGGFTLGVMDDILNDFGLVIIAKINNF